MPTAESTSTVEKRYSLSADGIKGKFDEATFAGVSATASFQESDTWRSLAPVTLHADWLNPGIELADMNASVSLEQSEDLLNSKWRVESFHAGLFGGDISLAEPAIVNFPFAGNRLRFELSNIAMQEVLALYQDQGLSGAGTLHEKFLYCLKLMVCVLKKARSPLPARAVG